MSNNARIAPLDSAAPRSEPSKVDSDRDEVSARLTSAAPPEPALSGPSSIFLIIVACTYLAADLAILVIDRPTVNSTVLVRFAFLTALAASLSLISVRLPVGFLTLSAIGTNAAALSLPPRLALIVGLLTGVVITSVISRPQVAVRACQILAVGLWTGAGAFLAVALTGTGLPLAAVQAVTVIAIAGMNVMLTGLIGVGVLRSHLWSQVLRNFNRHWIGAFAYFCIAAVVVSNVLDASVKGYVLASFTAILSLALGDAIAGHEVRIRLQAELLDAARYLGHSRVIEGTIHNVRNHLAAGLGYLEEMELSHDSAELRRSASIVASAVSDAVHALNDLQTGASPRVRWADQPIDISTTGSDVVELLQSSAGRKRVRCQADRPKVGRPALVRGDPLLLRQAITNLVLNAIEAVPTGGHVWVRTGTRGDKVMLQVADNGPGIPDKYRDRLFEPHFTTKPSGSGIGLFMSYGIIREHRGDLLYEGNKNGAVFTILLPSA